MINITASRELIVKYNALSFKNNRAYFNDELFTGGGLKFEGDNITARIEFVRGKTIGEFNSLYICATEKEHYICNIEEKAFNGKYLEQTDEMHYSYGSELSASGVFYIFDDDRCCEIIQLNMGIHTGQSVAYFPDGHILNFSKIKKTNNLYVREYLTLYYKNRTIESYGFTVKANNTKANIFELRYTEQVQLSSFRLTSNTLVNLHRYKALLLYPEYTNIDLMLSTEVACNLSLTDDGITDEIIDQIFFNKKISSMNFLSFLNCNVTKKAFNSLTNIQHIETLLYDAKKALEFTDNDITIEDLQRLKQTILIDEIYFNSTEVI